MALYICMSSNFLESSLITNKFFSKLNNIHISNFIFIKIKIIFYSYETKKIIPSIINKNLNFYTIYFLN